MSSTFIFFSTVLMSITFLDFQVDDSTVQQSDDTLAVKPDGFITEELASYFAILAIVIFGIWGILISLGIYNF